MKRKRKSPSKTASKRGAAAARARRGASPELQHVSQAQLGPDPEKRRYRPQDDDASIQDALNDWPED